MRFNLGSALALGLTIGAAPSAKALARDYPNRTITIVVPLAPGSGLDAVVRLYADKLSQAFGKPVIVENKPGAALMLAAQYVAGAAPTATRCWSRPRRRWRST
jgi:tripartite-type tricarboxylate transporter receptor subunit TctC